MSLKQKLKQILPAPFKEMLLKKIQQVCMFSVNRALKEKRMDGIYKKLEEIVPDLTHQYSTFTINDNYLIKKVRALHAFQVSMVREALSTICQDNNGSEELTVVDIGDSAGTHIQYIKDFFPEYKLRCLSVNMDPQAVVRIKGKNLEAVCARAEEIKNLSIDADLFLSFEMLEHLMNPSEFLYRLSKKTNCKIFVVTVPYLAKSRVGLRHIRRKENKDVFSENTHLFELSPADWKLLFQHSGWRIINEDIYYQYPRKSLLTPFLRRLWREWDYEGFYGAILIKDNTWSKLYKSWEPEGKTENSYCAT